MTRTIIKKSYDKLKAIKDKIMWTKTEVGKQVDLSKVKTDGKHIRVEVYNVPRELTFDYHLFYRFLSELPAKVGMGTLTPPIIVSGIPTNPGLTGILVIDYSHISFHAFAEKNRINFDLYSCKDFDPNIVIQHAEQHFKLSRDNMIIKEDFRF
ncbi:hypothetical protein GOV09_06515 [Candidatus Woesearchaeota archaeon]|nr:hypothetical protein [Candidatus Woesearchaeota archaeon]